MSCVGDDNRFVTDPEKWLHDISEQNDFVGIVIFRGSWCKFDKHYLQKLGDYSKDKMPTEKLKLIAWTSEGAAAAKKADDEWNLTKNHGFDAVIGDETNALAKYLIDDCLLEKLVISTPEEAHVESLITPDTYPNGLVQPGMIWYAHHGTVVLQWEATVEAPHYGGPNRPHPEELFDQVIKRKHALDKGEAVIPVHGNTLKQCASPWEVNCVIM
ncbi:hypothetical protein IV203_038514 [Nitzschia inconspicua]|uniref:Uncharacterized protein n=1 Tax=Nitzschia inconspicua TaxID=303405 RepID=A0A9K3LRK1_9STRA|nr:hypothetical protein IV203_038514 [Nitzschia inconspicua]